MNNSLPERRPLVLLIVLLSALLILMSYQVRTGRGISLLEDTLFRIASPFLNAVASTFDSVVDFWNSYVDLRGTYRENQELQAEIAKLREFGRMGEEFRRENLRLREMLELRDAQEYPSLAARVLSLELTGQNRIALIDRGKREGIKINMPVINREGVVGRIVKVYPHVSKVQLLIDPNSGVAAVLQRTRGQGMVVGLGDRGCRMEYLSGFEEVEVGDVVVTSGLDQIYPKGVVVGVVRSVQEGDQLTKSVAIDPEVGFHRLEEVLILFRNEEPTGGKSTP